MDAKTIESRLRSKFLNLRYDLNHKHPDIAKMMDNVASAQAFQEIYVIGGFAALKIIVEDIREKQPLPAPPKEGSDELC